MIVGASWMEDQRRAALTDTALLARRIAQGSRAALVAGPRGPWSAAMLSSVGQTNADRQVCEHLARVRFVVIPQGPRPLIVPRPGHLTCVPCATPLVPARTSSDACAGCDRVTLALRPVVAHGAVLVMLGLLCPRCLAVEIRGTPTR